MQNKLTQPGFLHDEKGRLTESGYATELIKTYDRQRVAAGRARIKEWDYYLINSDAYALALTIADNGYMGLDSVSFMDFEKNAQTTCSSMKFFTLGKRGLPPSSVRGNVHARGKGYSLTFENNGVKRRLFGQYAPFGGHGSIQFDVTLTDAPRDSMVIVTPFKENPKAFYYNQKINCLRASGRVLVDDQEYLFAPAHSFAVLDWGRGVWTYKNTWYWGSASGLVDGAPFGFNIGYGFGDTSAASENMVFWRGVAHKLSKVNFNIPMKNGREDYLAPWTFTSDDGRFEMDFAPILDRASLTDFKLLCSDQHQVFGWMDGTITLDDGTVIRLEHFMAMAEKVRNKW